ncbi:MAG: hypothetical protein ABIX44_04175, partial [Cryobacterium sp.]
MTLPPRHTMTGPGAFKMRRGFLVFAVTALILIALGLAVQAAVTSNNTPAGNIIIANNTDGVDAAGGRGGGTVDGDDEDAAVTGPAGPSATPAPRPSPVTAPPGVITKELATRMVTGFVVSAAPLDPGSDVADRLSTVAKGAILAELENRDQELEANGWTLSGKPVVKSVTILSSNLTASPSTALVQACVDSSKVVTLDSDAKPVGGPPPTSAALNLYSLQ